MILSSSIIEIFEYLYKRVRENPRYEYLQEEKDGSLISNFLKKLDKVYGLESIGREFLFQYLLFQFDYWKDKDIKSLKGIPLNWVIGEKAFDRWEKKVNFQEQWFHILAWASSCGVRWEDLEQPFRIDLLSVRDEEELEKTRFWGSEKGFVNCINSTNLFNPSSRWCNVCKFSQDCKELLKEMYPGLYNKRLNV